MSITAAAQDLHLTQSAVSRQIRSLEEHLGVTLLKRGYRSVAFTAEGAQLFRLADPWLAQLGDLTAQWRAPERRTPVTVTTTIGVASLWLLPRLGEFQAEHPAIDVRVAADNRVLDIERDDVDIAIRYSPRAAAPDGAQWLFGEAVTPVAHPSLGISVLDPATLSHAVLLEFDDPSRPWLQWTEWLQVYRLGHVAPKGMLRFNQYDQVVHAALAGHGIALGRRALVDPLLNQQRLIAVGEPLQSAARHAYWMIRAARARSSEVDVVANWLAARARDTARTLY